MFFKNTLRNVDEITQFVSQYIHDFPPNSLIRMRNFLLYERIMRKYARPAKGKYLPGSIQKEIEKQASLFIGYMVLFAHDDAIDKYDLGTMRIYEQLSRCLAAYLISTSTDDQPKTIGALRILMGQWSNRLHILLANEPEIVGELSFLLSLSFLNEVPDNEIFTIQHLFFIDNLNSRCTEWLNMTIVSAMGMGLAFRNISILLREYLSDDAVSLQNRSEFLVKTMIRCMYAQAHSPEQKQLNSLEYEEFIKLLCMKSTLLLDMSNYISDQVNEPRFFSTRYSKSRVCDQIFDDISDFDDDTYDGIINLIHMRILEQGRLAEMFLEMTRVEPISISIVQKLLAASKILQIEYDQTFVYHNPFIRAARDSAGNLRSEPADAEIILREIWVNAPNELNWQVESLAKHRLALYKSMKIAWQEKDFPTVLNIVFQSNFPAALLKSLHLFVRKNKWVIIDNYKKYAIGISGYVAYYSIMIGIKVLQLNVWKKRISHSARVKAF
jgi:hypothetical protein